MKIFKISLVAILLLAFSTTTFASNVNPKTPTLPSYLLKKPTTFSVTLNFGLSQPDAYGGRMLCAYITDTDVPGFANRVAPAGSPVISGYITMNGSTFYGQITFPSGQTYGTVALGSVDLSLGVSLNDVSISTGSSMGGLPLIINSGIGFVYL